MSTLKHLAATGHTVVASIHQPRSSIFALFDDLLLLAEGAVAYHGPADKVLDHFAALGHACPEHYNPAGAGAGRVQIGGDGYDPCFWRCCSGRCCRCGY
jgi:ABC-type multidrug transport system ATPase subunit